MTGAKMKDIKIGLIARGDKSGLSIQTQDFYRHMNPSKVLLLDLEHLNRQRTDRSLYPGAMFLPYVPYPSTGAGSPAMRGIINEFLDGLDVVFSCETFYDYYLIEEAQRRGVKTILQYNFELMDYIHSPQLPKPDLFMAPSMWRYDDVPFDNKVFVPVPVDTVKFPFRLRDEAKTFIHPAGVPTTQDRNGTHSLMGAWRQVKSNAQLLIRSPQTEYRATDGRIRCIKEAVECNTQLYHDTDVFIMPRKYAGLSLPLNEAMALGLPVVMTDLSPQNEFLHPQSLVSTVFAGRIMTKMLVDVHEANQLALAAKVDQLAGSPELVKELSEWSGTVANTISWNRMKPVYDQVFECVMDGQTPSEMFSWRKDLNLTGAFL